MVQNPKWVIYYKKNCWIVRELKIII